MNVATSVNVLYRVGTMPEQLERVARAGFRHIDINFNDWAMDWYEDLPPVPETAFSADDWRDWVEGIRQFGEAHGVTYTQAHSPCYGYACAGERRDYLDRMIYRCLESAAMLSIPWVVMHTLSMDGPFDAAHIAKVKDMNLRWLDPFLNKAAALGVGVALENMPNHLGPNGELPMPQYSAEIEQLVDLVDTIDSPLVGICWDTGHAHIHKADQVASLRAAGKRLKTLHIQDGKGIVDDHTAPFYGTIDWPPIMRALREIGYEGNLTFEAHNLIRAVPDRCKDTALLLLLDIGRELVRLSGM